MRKNFNIVLELLTRDFETKKFLELLTREIMKN